MLRSLIEIGSKDIPKAELWIQTQPTTAKILADFPVWIHIFCSFPPLIFAQNSGHIWKVFLRLLCFSYPQNLEWNDSNGWWFSHKSCINRHVSNLNQILCILGNFLGLNSALLASDNPNLNPEPIHTFIRFKFTFLCLLSFFTKSDLV